MIDKSLRKATAKRYGTLTAVRGNLPRGDRSSDPRNGSDGRNGGMTVRLKSGDWVVMNDKYYVNPENKGKVWRVAGEPWMVCGTEVVKLEGVSGCYAVDGLELVR